MTNGPARVPPWHDVSDRPDVPDSAVPMGPPPREVHPWTTVVGHQPARPAGGSRVEFCSCGWRPGTDTAAANFEEHLANAWPVLLPQGRGEALADWSQRLWREIDVAYQDLALAEKAAGFSDPIRPGQPFPLVTDVGAESDRVTVLERQAQEVQAKLDKRSPI